MSKVTVEMGETPARRLTVPDVDWLEVEEGAKPFMGISEGHPYGAVRVYLQPNETALLSGPAHAKTITIQRR